MKKTIVCLLLIFSLTGFFSVFSFASCLITYNSQIHAEYMYGGHFPYNDAMAETTFFGDNDGMCNPNTHYNISARTTMHYYDANFNVVSGTCAQGPQDHYGIASISSGQLTINDVDDALQVDHKGWIKCNTCGTQTTRMRICLPAEDEYYSRWYNTY